ncbi:MAG: Deoxycytidine monophosphate (dCMP) deaminase [Candelina mexicana]|nr:MAG: Deoxycytidine monophosphate (dCMP) deaminase [Candelina mexicana]
MLIGLCGGICAGKHSVAQFLVDRQGFTQLYIRRKAISSSLEELTSDFCIASDDKCNGIHDDKVNTFADAEQLMDFVTRRWRKRWVTTDVWDETTLDILLRRPFFLLLSVDAPVSTRWQRFKERCERRTEMPPTLEEFVLRNDDHLYHHSAGLALLIERAQVRLLNSASSLAALHASLQSLDLTNEQRLRPSWDQYFMQLASLAAQRSNCMKRRVGCVLVREKRVISTGYNGTPRNLKNCNEGGCSRCNNGHGAGLGLATCLCIHAEENALLEAGRERIREGAILYCDT